MTLVLASLSFGDHPDLLGRVDPNAFLGIAILESAMKGISRIKRDFDGRKRRDRR